MEEEDHGKVRYLILPAVKKLIIDFTWTLAPQDEVQISIFVTKHTHKQRTNICFFVCSNEAYFCFNVLVAAKTSVWFHCLTCLSDPMLKLPLALSISWVFWQCWRWNNQSNSKAYSSWQPCFSAVCFGELCRSDLITPVRCVTQLCSFHMEKAHPHRDGLPKLAEQVTWLVGVPHLTCERYHEKERDCIVWSVTPSRRGTSPARGPPISMWTYPDRLLFIY